MAPRIAATIEHVIRPHGGSSELKWAKIKRRNEPMYRDLISGFAQLIDNGFLHYYCLVVDTSTVNHALYNEGDRDLGFTKFLFTLLYKFARVYRSNPRFYVFLDDRTTRHTPDKLRMTLNARVRRDLKPGYDPFRVVKFAESGDSRLIQMTDVITGAIACETNGHHLLVGAAAHRISILSHARQSLNLPTLAAPTQYGAHPGFDIWHLDFEAKLRRALRS